MAFEEGIPSSKARSLEMIHEGAAWRIATWNNVLIIVASDVPVAADIAGIRRAQGVMRARSGVVGAVTIVTDIRLGRLDLSESMRTEIREIARGVGLRGHAAIVIEPDNLVGMAVRTVLTAIFAVAQPDVPHRIFDLRHRAAEHLMHRVTTGWSAEELVAVMRELSTGL